MLISCLSRESGNLNVLKDGFPIGVGNDNLDDCLC